MRYKLTRLLTNIIEKTIKYVFTYSIFRSVEPQDRAIGLGMNAVVMRLLGKKRYKYSSKPEHNGKERKYRNKWHYDR